MEEEVESDIHSRKMAYMYKLKRRIMQSRPTFFAEAIGAPGKATHPALVRSSKSTDRGAWWDR